MADVPPQLPLLVFDGDCGFCTSAAAWISARWPAEGPFAVPWQRLGDRGLSALGLTEQQVRDAAYWVDERGVPSAGALAVARAMAASDHKSVKLVGRSLSKPPLEWVAKPGYALVSKYRYRLPGGTPACRT